MRYVLILALAFFQYVPAGPVFSHSGGSISEIQSASSSSGSGNSISATFVSNVTVGDLLWGACLWDSATATGSVTDSLNGTWTAVNSPVTGTGGLSTWRMQTFYKSGALAGATSPTCTATAGSGIAFAVHEARGVTTLDQHPAVVANTNATQGFSATTSTTTAANEYLVGGCGYANDFSSTVSPWIVGEQEPSFAIGATQYQIVSATGTYQLQQNQTGGNYLCGINTFK